MEIDTPWVRRVVRFERDLTAMLFALGRNVLEEARELGAIGGGDYRCDGFDERFALHLRCKPEYLQGVWRPLSGPVREVHVDTATLRYLLRVLETGLLLP